MSHKQRDSSLLCFLCRTIAIIFIVEFIYNIQIPLEKREILF